MRQARPWSRPPPGTVSFAGSVPTNGKSVTIETADGYSVTLTHLGSIGVAKGATVAEQDAVGTVGPSGTPEEAGPYVHLGIRRHGRCERLRRSPRPASSGQRDRFDRERSAGVAAELEQRVCGCAREEACVSGAGQTAGEGHEFRVVSGLTGTDPHRSPAPRFGRAGRSSVRNRPSAIARASGRALSGGRSSSRRFPSRSVSTPATRSGRRATVAQPRPEPASPLPALLCNGAVALFALWPAARRGSASPTQTDEPALERAGSPPGTAGVRAPAVLPRGVTRSEPVRMIWSLVGNAPEDPRLGRLALREWPAAPRPCRRPRGAVGRLRALSPAQGQRRPHGQRDGRARHAGDGLGRPRGRDPAPARRP